MKFNIFSAAGALPHEKNSALTARMKVDSVLSAVCVPCLFFLFLILGVPPSGTLAWFSLGLDALLGGFFLLGMLNWYHGTMFLFYPKIEFGSFDVPSSKGLYALILWFVHSTIAAHIASRRLLGVPANPALSCAAYLIVYLYMAFALPHGGKNAEG